MSKHRGFLVILTVALLVVLTRTATAASILSISSPGARSHQMNLLRIGRELSERGHTFTVLVSRVDTILQDLLRSRSFSNLKIIEYRGPRGVGTEAWGLNLSRSPIASLEELLQNHKDAALHIAADQSTLSRTKAEGYDLLMWDSGFWPGAVLQDLLNITSVEVQPLPVLLPWNWEYEQSIPNPIAYLPQYGTVFTTRMSYLQRVQNFVTNIFVKHFLLAKMLKEKQREFVMESGYSYKTYETGRSTAAAVIVVTDWALQFPQPMPPRVHLVGSVLAEDARPLPAELSAFLDQGLPDHHGQGAVFASPGTLALLTEDEVCSIAQGLVALDKHVLWRQDPQKLPGNTTLDSLKLTPKVKLIKWAPQNDVLGHPAVKAFLTQAGINSIHEAAYHAVPVVSVPLIADQVNNAILPEYHGFGVTVTPNRLSPVNGKAIQEAITQVMTDSAFQASADKVSRRLRNKPRHPAELAADVVERVLATDGDMYLETMQHALSWWQLSLLDVKAFLLSAALLVVGLLGGMLYGVYVLLRRVVRLLWSKCSYRLYGKQKSF